MEMIKLVNGGAEMATSDDQLRALSNLMNEVCNGLYIDDFEKSVGVARGTAAALLARINSATPAKAPPGTESSEIARGSRLVLELGDVGVLLRSLDEVVKQIDRDELHARIGLDLEDVVRLRNELVALANQLGA